MLSPIWGGEQENSRGFAWRSYASTLLATILSVNISRATMRFPTSNIGIPLVVFVDQLFDIQMSAKLCRTFLYDNMSTASQIITIIVY